MNIRRTVITGAAAPALLAGGIAGQSSGTEYR